MKENIHAGHRSRVKKEFLERGFDHNTPPHKILEMLLFFCVKQKDTNELAHELINRYKSLSGVFNAPVSELVQFKGITESNVVLLKMIMPLVRVCIYEERKSLRDFNSYEEIGEFLVDEFTGYTTEHISILCLSSKGTMLEYKCIAEGDPASVGVSTRDVMKLAIDSGSTGVIMAHNHPSGVALPSSADIEITKALAESLRHIGVRLLDHMIISSGDYVSMRSSKRFKDIFIQDDD